VLALPDRHRLLERVDAEPRGIERFGSVRRGRDHRDRRFGQREIAHAVQQRESLDDGPTAPGFSGHVGQPAHRFLFVRLVGDAGDAVASFGALADNPEEHHHRTG